MSHMFSSCFLFCICAYIVAIITLCVYNYGGQHKYISVENVLINREYNKTAIPRDCRFPFS